MSLLSDLSAGSSVGGSVNSAQGWSQSQEQGWSNTAGREATAANMQSAEAANSQQLAMMREAMEFNAKEAEKQRKWQEEMANSVYTRSVKNMIEAGINPILAANMGLSGASVGSGATANISAPSAHMGTAIAEQNSANTANSASENSSYGTSWNQSTNGLAEGLKQMGELIKDAFAGLNSAINLNVNMQNLSDMVNDTLPDTKANNNLAAEAEKNGDKVQEYSANMIGGMVPKFMRPLMNKLWKNAIGDDKIPSPYGKGFTGGGAGHRF